MKNFYLLTKTLLVAVMLLGGQILRGELLLPTLGI